MRPGELPGLTRKLRLGVCLVPYQPCADMEVVVGLLRGKISSLIVIDLVDLIQGLAN